MGRKIKISFNDKDYIIEYNRESVMKLMEKLNEKESDMEHAIEIVYCGLLKHHKDDMPERDVIFGWVLSMGDKAEGFVQALQGCVQEVLDAVKKETESGNLKWEVVN